MFVTFLAPNGNMEVTFVSQEGKGRGGGEAGAGLVASVFMSDMRRHQLVPFDERLRAKRWDALSRSSSDFP